MVLELTRGCARLARAAFGRPERLLLVLVLGLSVLSSALSHSAVGLHDHSPEHVSSDIALSPGALDADDGCGTSRRCHTGDKANVAGPMRIAFAYETPSIAFLSFAFPSEGLAPDLPTPPPRAFS